MKLSIHFGQIGKTTLLAPLFRLFRVCTGLLRSAHTARALPGEILCANIAEGVHCRAVSRLTDAAITTRYLLVKVGSDANHIAVTGVGDIPLGFCTDETTDAEQWLAVNLLGAAGETQRGVASGTVTAGDFVVPGATGTVRTLPGTTGTYYIIGRAITTAATGEIVEIDPCIPVQRLVA